MCQHVTISLSDSVLMTTTYFLLQQGFQFWFSSSCVLAIFLYKIKVAEQSCHFAASQLSHAEQVQTFRTNIVRKTTI